MMHAIETCMSKICVLLHLKKSVVDTLATKDADSQQFCYCIAYCANVGSKDTKKRGSAHGYCFNKTRPYRFILTSIVLLSLLQY